MVVKIYSANELPDFKTFRRGAKKKYPWFDIASGEGFQFDPAVNLAGARAQISNAARNAPPDGVERKYICRVDQQNALWCIRIDGLPLEVREGWIRANAPPTPVPGQPITAEQYGEMRETGPHAVRSGNAGQDVDWVEPNEDPI